MPRHHGVAVAVAVAVVGGLVVVVEGDNNEG